MSRSYRAPYITDGCKGSKSRQFFKNYANRNVRNYTDDLANGRSYKKIGDTYNICDYRFRMRDNEDRPWKYNRK